MKKFAFRLSPLALSLMIIVSVIFAASAAINVYNAITVASEDYGKKITAVVLAAVSLISLVLTVAAAVYSKYVIKENYLYCRFGFIFTKTDIGEIFQLTEFKAQNKLVIYFKNEKYSVAVIKDKYYREFYDAIKAVNPKVIYTVQSADD